MSLTGCTDRTQGESGPFPMPEFEHHRHNEFRDPWEVFDVAVECDPQGARVRVTGELDLSTVSTLDRVLDGLADIEQGRLILDLDGVRFMDCAAISAIVRARRSAVRNGHRLEIRCRANQVRRLFELTGMLEQLTFESLAPGRDLRCMDAAPIGAGAHDGLGLAEVERPEDAGGEAVRRPAQVAVAAVVAACVGDGAGGMRGALELGGDVPGLPVCEEDIAGERGVRVRGK